MTNIDKNMKFEDALKTLEETVTKLGQRDLTIDEAISLHEKALEQSKQCEEILNNTKQKIEIYQR